MECKICFGEIWSDGDLCPKCNEKNNTRKVNLIGILPVGDGEIKTFITNDKDNSIVFTFAEAQAEMKRFLTSCIVDAVVSEDESHFKTKGGLIMLIQPVKGE